MSILDIFNLDLAEAGTAVQLNGCAVIIVRLTDNVQIAEGGAGICFDPAVLGNQQI